MPSAKVLEQKKAIVSTISEKIKNSCAGVVVDYKGISVAEDTKLRKELREAGVDYFVAKNTLIKLAAQDAELTGLDDVLEGTTSIALHDSDYTAAARILSKYADNKDTTFAIKSGFIDGEVVSVEEINKLAKIPSKEVLLAQLCGGLNSIIAGLAIAINAVKEKKESEDVA